MANGVNAALRASVPAEKVEVNQQHGRLRVLRDTFTLTVEGDQTVNMGAKLPAGARIFDARLKNSAAGGTTGTLAFGYEGDTDAFLAAYASATAQLKNMHDEVAATHGVELAEEKQVVVTVVDGDSTLIGVTLEAVVYYVVD